MGIGFTDVVKRPTGSATDVSAEELRHGTIILTKKLEVAGAPLVVFAFKGAAVQLLGSFAGNGFLPDALLGPSQVYVIPGPYERRDTVDQALGSLAHWWGSHGSAMAPGISLVSTEGSAPEDRGPVAFDLVDQLIYV